MQFTPCAVFFVGGVPTATPARGVRSFLRRGCEENCVGEGAQKPAQGGASEASHPVRGFLRTRYPESYAPGAKSFSRHEIHRAEIHRATQIDRSTEMLNQIDGECCAHSSTAGGYRRPRPPRASALDALDHPLVNDLRFAHHSRPQGAFR